MPQSLLQTQNQLPVVLIVDDNSAIRDMVSWALAMDGFEAAEATEGQEALNWIYNAAQEGRCPSAILLDLAMPGMDGSTFLVHLRQQWTRLYASTPMPAIIVITAGHRSDVVSLGVERVILKPFHVRELLDIVHSLTN
ncbi:MAG TPA: response regulator [Dictyobacter sp.]|jgi:DNA-binding response OmpR family regulator|nr:response regulator [Dictyobacter sp.]